MKQTPRSLAVDLLNRIDRTGAFAEPLLNACLDESLLNTQDRHLLTSLIYGTLRMRGHLDWLIQRLYRGNFSSMQEGIRNVLRTALYQFLFMDRIPVFALVDEAVELTKLRYPGREKLVNALLRNAVRKEKNNDLSYPDLHKNPVEHISVVHSHPSWLVRRWIRIYGPERTLLLCKANNEIPPVTIRINQLKTTRSALKTLLEREGFAVSESVFSPDGLLVTEQPRSLRATDAIEQGLFVLQDEASQLISHLVAPTPGEKVLDLCCGSGIKTTHLAALMKNEGLIRAVDIYPAKLESLHSLSAKMGISIIKTLQADASTEQNDDLQDEFDRILVDAPCSGLGTLRRNPEIKWRLQPRKLQSYGRLQELILNRAATHLRHGGRLVYSTCTVLPEENDLLIKKFLSNHRDFFPITSFDTKTIASVLIDEDGFFRTAPDQYCGMDGFFAAVLIKD